MKTKSTDISGTCCSLIAIALINISFGAIAFDYALKTLFNIDIPWYGDVVCGFFTGQFVIPVAIVCWVLKLCGVPAPFFSNHIGI